MKRVLHIIFLIGLMASVKAQPYGNEWIDYSKTYYKFKLGKTSLYRLPYSTLVNAGISPSFLTGTSFKLFRNGQEIPLYVTTNGLFGSGDYIEFYGERNDGKTDTPLYKTPDEQGNPLKSLFSDTATFFLTIDPFSINARMQQQNNDISIVPEKEKYCYYTNYAYGIPSTKSFYSFRGMPVSSYFSDLYNSDFDKGEGWYLGSFDVNGFIGIYTHIQSQQDQGARLFFRDLYNSEEVNATVSITTAHGEGIHTIRTNINSLFDTIETFAGPILKKQVYQVKNRFLSGAGNNGMSLRELTANKGDYALYGSFEYPRTLSFENLPSANFSIKKNNDVYLEIKNLNLSSTTPVLYDLNNRQRYIGIVDTVYKFYLNATALAKDNLFISAQDASSVPTISSISAINFTNFANAGQQGDYLIVTNKKLKTSTIGVDYIEQYRQYRSSAQGGNFNAKTYFIDELNDQFAFGINQHPLAIRNFINYAYDKFTNKPQLLYIIGKGFEYTYNRNGQSYIDRSLVQTYGEPASDVLLTARSGMLNFPQIGVGRLAVTKGDQIKDYLDKVREYEANLNDTSNASETPYNKLWMKNVLHLGGGKSIFEQQQFRAYLDNYKTIIEAPKFGGNVSGLFKNSTDPIQIAQNIFLDSLVNSGVSLITFFGHSATTTTDFNMEPAHMDNRGKYHLMLTNGCFVGSVFADMNTLSEQFVITPNKAAIGYIAPVTYAVASDLNSYSTEFYNNYSNTLYNDRIGTILSQTAKNIILGGGYINPMVGEQMIYHGDPGLRVNTHYRPDYYIDESSIIFEPQNINAAADSFLIKVIVKNLGAAVNDLYVVNVDRVFPNGQIQSTRVRIPSARYIDTVLLWIHSDRLNGPGLNTFRIKVDYENSIAEYSELNNEVTVTKLILADDIIPIYPYEFSMVNDPNFDLVFSTADAFANTKPYIFQIDTTELFNSPLLTQQKINAPGATIHWKPSIPLLQNKVYYWRGTLDTTASGIPANWKKSSFLYNTSLSTGWNQSHYFQYLRNTFSTLNLKEDRQFYYPNTVRSLQIKNGIISDQLITAYWDGYLIARNAWQRRGFIFFVYDANTGQGWQTFQVGNTCRGPYNDYNCNTTPVDVFEFITRGTTTTEGKQERQYAIDFLNNIPCNAYVLGYSFYNAGYTQWASDSTQPGDVNLFKAFENLGVSKIRQQVENAPFAFFLKKCDPSFPPVQIQKFQPNIIDTTLTFSGTWTKGTMTSPLIGPSRGWKDFDMDWHAKESNTQDDARVNLYGYDTSGARVLLRDNLLKGSVTSLNNIDHKLYPYVQMQWLTKDDALGTAPQMDYWRLYYEKAPEAVVNPTIYFSKTRDTIASGENLNVTVAVENVSPVDMDSLLVRYIIKDASNNITIFYKRFGPLPAKQVRNITFDYNFPGFSFFGLNYITIEVNPNNDQPEQFHFNNFAETTVFVERDKINPLLDVTFDGRHITDGEYISASPEILFRLKDENKYLALNDTSCFLIYMYYPNNPTEAVQIAHSQANVTFIPATNLNNGKSNEARLIYKPTLADGTYEIRAQGIDRSLNDAGKYDYRIKFKVDSKPSITNVLNYPNPFSTSTQFVFTVTGAAVPDQLIIQIFSASGKVVKEITREELGNLHIGTNLTDYKWDGTDNFGDRLANGVYFYRVMTRNLDGTTTEVKQTSIDKYFKHGYGKLYIIR